jgi:predicted nuclease of predicted toxin-antitoxin system
VRFKVDENLPAEAAAILIAAGHDALSVLDQQMGGRPDLDVAAVCQLERRTLLTLDLDFGDIRHYPPNAYSGLIVLRPYRQDKPAVLEMITRLLPALAAEPLDQRLWIVDENSVRIRGGGEADADP